MKNKILITLFVLAGSYGSITAQTPAVMLSDKAGWHKIGERHVAFAKDRDEIMVIGANRFSAIRFKVTEAAIDLQQLVLYYDKDEKQVIDVRTPIKAGTESRVFDLKGTERELRKIVFVYKTLPNQKDENAHVEIWGLKTNADEAKSGNANPDAAARAETHKSTRPSPAVMVSDKTGWHKIGDRHVDLVKDRDEILVVGADRFSAIKFAVTEASIDLQMLEVYYEGGDKQDIDVRTPIMAGSESRVINLNGSERRLKKIVFVYKTLPNQNKEKAEVAVWGLKVNADKDKSGNANPDAAEKAETHKSTTPSPAVMVSDKTGWHKIGERHVDLVKDRDEISVLVADRFSAIKFIVTEASIDLLVLEVYYEDGDKQDIDVRTPIMAGSESRVIDLNGGERSLKKIVFVYKTLPNQNKEKAEVAVWGLKTNAAGSK